MWVTAVQEKTAQNTWWLQELSTSGKQKHDKFARCNSHNLGLLNRTGPVLQICQENRLLSGSPRSNAAQFWLQQEPCKNGWTEKCSVDVEPQAFALQADLRWLWAGVEKLVTGREITWISSLYRQKGHVLVWNLESLQRCQKFLLNKELQAKCFVFWKPLL